MKYRPPPSQVRCRFSFPAGPARSLARLPRAAIITDRPWIHSTPAEGGKRGTQGSVRPRHEGRRRGGVAAGEALTTCGPDSLSVAAARRRRARTCTLEAPHVNISGSGAGPVGTRSRWWTLLAWGTPAYVPARLETEATAALPSSSQLMGTVAIGGRRDVCTLLLCLCSRQRPKRNNTWQLATDSYCRIQDV